MTPRLRQRLALLSAACAAIALVAYAIVFGAAAAGGWLCAFVLISMIPIGSLALLLVHGISGGQWGRDLAPVLVPAARCIALLFLGFLPILLFRSVIFHWEALDLPQDVLSLYLNPLFFDARTLVALAIWSALAWCNAWRSQLFAAVGLVVHLIVMTLIPADWVLSLRPGSTSAGFGLGFGIEQIAASLAFAAVLAPQGRDPHADRDLAGLILTALLGTMYFVYMQFIVIWYGNIPDKVHWYAVRASDGWPLLALAAFMFGAALPFLAILNPVVRRSTGALRVVGLLVLSGIALHVAWLTAPAFGGFVLFPAVLATLLMALLLLTASQMRPIAGKAGVDVR
jgi:hypothetical protein